MDIIPTPVKKLIEIKAMVSRKTGLILAVCEELDGFSVFGNSIEEVEERLPAAIRDHFDMLGFDVEDLEVFDSKADSVFSSVPSSISAQAILVEKRPA